MSLVTYQRRGPIAVLNMRNPPLNSLGLGLRQALVAMLDRAAADRKVAAVVLTGDDRAFSAGADIREFAAQQFGTEPNLLTVIAIVERSAKPVIAAISGACMGGGLELALACHFRIATENAKIAFPEVKLGLIPGAGGTQRFPRLVGLESAVNLIASGNTLPAKALRASALFDQLVPNNLAAAAEDFANKVVSGERKPLLARDRRVDYTQADAFLQFARTAVGAVARGMPAPLKCVEAVGASVGQSFDAGLAVEQTIFRELLASPEAQALQHAFFAERAAAKIADIPERTRSRDIKRVAVIGAGTMGGGIAMNFANAGIPVALLELKQEALDRGLATVRKNYEASVKKGRMTATQLDDRMKLIQPTLKYEDIAKCDLVIEAVFEDLKVKEQVFEQLDKVMKKGAILASNTSTLDLNAIARFTKRPRDVVGMHFFSPANVMKLLEVVRGTATGKDVLATVMGVAKKIGKTAVVSGVCDGFIGNRMLEQYFRQALFMLEEGASLVDVDKAIEKFGFAMGPFRMSDMAGNDIGWHIRKRRYVEYPEMKYSKIADKICELGRFGQKTGAGWYRYEPGRRDALPDPLVEEIIIAERQALGVKPRRIAESEIVDRLVYALTNEGAQLLDEGIAQRSSDIDMVYLTGYGFPVYRGGPMFHAERKGMINVVRRMREFAGNAHGDPSFWRPAALLLRAESLGTFDAAKRAAPQRRTRKPPSNKRRPLRTTRRARRSRP